MRISVSGERDARGSSVTSARPDCTGSVAQCNGNSARPGPRLSPGAATQMILVACPGFQYPDVRICEQAMGVRYPPVNPKAGRSALGQPGHRTKTWIVRPTAEPAPTPCNCHSTPVDQPHARKNRHSIGEGPRGYCCWQRRFFARSQREGTGIAESEQPSWRGHSDSVIPVLSVPSVEKQRRAMGHLRCGFPPRRGADGFISLSCAASPPRWRTSRTRGKNRAEIHAHVQPKSSVCICVHLWFQFLARPRVDCRMSGRKQVLEPQMHTDAHRWPITFEGRLATSRFRRFGAPKLVCKLIDCATCPGVQHVEHLGFHRES